MSGPNEGPAPETREERCQFLERIGKFGAVTPPAITLMLRSTIPTNPIERKVRSFLRSVMNLSDLAVVHLLAVTPERSRIRRMLLKLIQENPGLRDVVAGFGQSFDPYPTCYRSTFITSDQLALAEDWLVVGRDIRTAQGRADELLRGAIRIRAQ